MILGHFKLIPIKIHTTHLQYLHSPFGKSKIISLTSSIIKNIVVFSARSRFPDQDQDQNRVLIVCLDLLQSVRSFL